MGRRWPCWPQTCPFVERRYEQELTELYNRWLEEHVSPDDLARLRPLCGVPEGGTVPRLRPAEFTAAAQLRFFTEAKFYMDLERRFFDGMAHYLKAELGVESLLVGTSDHNHGKSGYPLLASTSRLDIVDGHVYWQHPRYLTDAATGRNVGFEIPNSPMVNDPLHSTVVQLSRTAVAGKPYTVSEVNHPFPSEYACEGIPVLTACALLRDWDGVFWYTLAHEHLVGEPSPAMGHFDLGVDPGKMTQLAAGALVFLRGDVRAARQVDERSYSVEQVYESLRLPWSDWPYFTPGFPLGLPLIRATRIASFDSPAANAFEDAPQEAFVSNTKQLHWIGAGEKLGVVTVDAARTQAIVGFSKENQQTTANLALQLGTPFAAVTLSSLDDQPISSASRLLLTAIARVANTDMRWNPDRTSLEFWGRPPAFIEAVTGSVTLRNLAATTSVTAQPLDATGHLLGPELPLTKTDGGWTLSLGSPPTTWHLISVAR